MTPGLFVLLSVAGGAGAALRFVLDGLLRERLGARLPWGTAIINVSGSLLLGVLTGLLTRGLPEAVLTVLGIGLLGGYTTFSTASVETVRLIQQRRWAASLLYGLGVLVLSVAAGALGLTLVVS
ncbi:fluoride efflux transporter FluC [Amnibacterium kyonggiense]|uniref:Fluoride-specific ion channel FluC n=1 Tax=Amnibacterium kyonggiense TaxID=595671 RepID=A0A4V3EAF4_9MICO|nr:CrcB family protein [Amnibacterium kyonggiense]TDS76188.1 camphor resistance protein CrcB [Amnibacterium kyonggiense]